MSIEVRANGRLYLYTARRTAGRLRKTYHGRLSSEQAEAERAAVEERKAARRAERERVIAADREARGILDANAEFDRLADRLFRAVMAVLGFRLHARTEWRPRKGAALMSPFEALVARYGPQEPRPALTTFRADSAEEQEVLDRAARGDAGVLPTVREWLKDPAKLSWLGSVAQMAEHAIVRQVAGDDVAVAAAVAAKMRDQRERLEAETPNASLPVRLAVTRVVHNWVVVHCLEATAAKHTPGTPAALAAERQLASAERRLATSLKSLTVLRRLGRGSAVDAAKDAMQLAFLRKIGKAPPVAAAGDSDGIR